MRQTYSLRDVAKIIGVSPMALSKYKGKSGFSPKLISLLNLHGFNPDDILKSVNQKGSHFNITKSLTPNLATICGSNSVAECLPSK